MAGSSGFNSPAPAKDARARHKALPQHFLGQFGKLVEVHNVRFLIFLNRGRTSALPRSVSTSAPVADQSIMSLAGLPPRMEALKRPTIELIGDVLPRGIDVGERLAERLLVVMPAAPVARISRVASSAQRCETVAD
jgi:hypothetical protein